MDDAQILVAIVPAEIKDDVIDTLIALEPISGFNLTRIAGYSREHSHFSLRERVENCLEAGCDIVLVCQPEDTGALMIDPPQRPQGEGSPVKPLYGRAVIDKQQLAEVKSEGIREWAYWRSSLERLGASWS